MDRRNFLNSAGRYLILGTLIAVAGTLLFKKPSSGKDDCTKDLLCKRCSQFSGCDLPKALRNKD